MITLADPCPETRRAPLITWRLHDYHCGRDLIIILLGDAYHWMLDQPDAQPSSGQPDYIRCLTAARLAFGLPIIGEGRFPATSPGSTES